MRTIVYTQLLDELTCFDTHDGERSPAVGPKMYVSKALVKKYKPTPCCPGCNRARHGGSSGGGSGSSGGGSGSSGGGSGSGSIAGNAG